MHFVDRGGTFRGARAVNRFLAPVPLLGTAARAFDSIPPLLRLESLAYDAVARHRERLSRLLGTRRCALIRDDDAGANP